LQPVLSVEKEANDELDHLRGQRLLRTLQGYETEDDEYKDPLQLAIELLLTVSTHGNATVTHIRVRLLHE
jgi:hypothetical protein